MADKNFQADEDIIDLTELIEAGDAPDAETASQEASPRNAPAPDLDFDAILARAEAGDGRREEAERPVDPDEQLDMSAMDDIDNLLESLDIPDQARPAPAQVPPPKAAAQPSAADLGFSDLDSVLDDLLGPGDAGKDVSEPAAPPQGVQTPRPEAPVSPAAEPVAPKSDQAMEDAASLDADLDNILAEMEPVPAAAAEAAAAPPPDALSDDVEELLADTTQQAEAAGDDFELPADLDALLEEAPAQAAEHDYLPPQMTMPPEPPAPAFPAAPAGERPAVEAPAAYPPELVAGVCRNILGTQVLGAQESLQDFARQLGAQTAHIEDLTRQLGEFGKRLLASDSKLSSARARIAALEKGADQSVSLADLLRDGTPLHAGIKSLITAAVGEALQELPRHEPDENVSRQMDGLNGAAAAAAERLTALETSLGELAERVASDEPAQELATRQDEVEARLAGLEQRLAALAGQNAEADEKLAALAGHGAETEARLEALEKRVAQLELQLDARIEKSAAAAVAAILHEEITRLLAGE